MGLKSAVYRCALLCLLSTTGPVTYASDAEPSNTRVKIETSLGDITLQLFDQRSPITVKNFLHYVDSGHYDGTIFHRVIPQFMIQGGGFDADMMEKTTAEPIQNESKNRVHNERGTIAMARTSDPHSATAQFFINVRMNIKLDYRMGEFGYAVFGKVISGMDVVDNIAIQRTGARFQYQDVPVDDIVIKRVTRMP